MRNTIIMLALFCNVLLAHAEEIDGVNVNTVNPSPVVRDDRPVSSPIYTSAPAPRLQSAIAMIYDEQDQRPLYAKNADNVVPIASITKLMTAMVILDAKLPMDEPISISAEDRDHLKGTRSRMRNGMTLTRDELVKLALMASENRAAAALARTYPGGTPVMLAMMNAKARELGMTSTQFFDPTGVGRPGLACGELHQRGRPLPGDAGQDRRPPDGYRAAGFLGQAHPRRRCRPRQELAGEQAFVSDTSRQPSPQVKRFDVNK